MSEKSSECANISPLADLGGLLEARPEEEVSTAG